MNTLVQEIQIFLKATGIPQYKLAQESGVSVATVCRLANGKQKDTKCTTASDIRKAISKLQPPEQDYAND